MKYLFIPIVFIILMNPQTISAYELPDPGMLPNHPFYKLKVLRNKITEKIILTPIKKIEFDLLMADKTINASHILFSKGYTELAKETALKGENYYSMLVQDYNKALLKGKTIPKRLDKNITESAIKHKEIFRQLADIANEHDKEIFETTYKFVDINYSFIEGLRKPVK